MKNRQLFLSAKPEKTNCQFPLRANSRQFVGKTPPFPELLQLRNNVPKGGGWQNNSSLNEKPAVVFIGKARENQLPISFSRKFASIRGQNSSSSSEFFSYGTTSAQI
jgi:hypothetical protein